MENDDNKISQIMTKEEYNEYVKEITPKISVSKNIFRAFITGGVICLIGQIINTNISKFFDLSKNDTAAWTSIILVAISVILTGFNLYSKIVKWGGAGALVPITGFANSVASPAIEAKAEGWVFGVGCQIFKIAGPVILYGVSASFFLGLIYYFLR